jgi:hypothetical protein
VAIQMTAEMRTEESESSWMTMMMMMIMRTVISTYMYGNFQIQRVIHTEPDCSI